MPLEGIAMKKMAVGVVSFVVLGVWGTCFYVTKNAWGDIASSVQQYGAFGDSFGTVNALFSGLALAGVVAALMLQAHDAKQQREEARVQGRISACAAIIEAEKTLSDYYEQAVQQHAPPPLPAHPEITWADMMEHSRKRILDMSAALETERKNLMAQHDYPETEAG